MHASAYAYVVLYLNSSFSGLVGEELQQSILSSDIECVLVHNHHAHMCFICQNSSFVVYEE